VSAAGVDDLSLAQRIVAGRDPVAFEQLYVRHTPMLYAVALRFTCNSHDAEDAVHDTWVRSVSALSKFRGASTLRTWLTGVLLNRLREGSRARVHEPLDEWTEPAGSAPVRLPRDIDPIDLERAVQAMPLRYREVLLLHDVEGFTHDEIGGMLGIEPGTSKSQLARGRGWLRTHLNGTRSSI
jgi:RNA polymerase sigma-70 factor (ECF subfamily)